MFLLFVLLLLLFCVACVWGMLLIVTVALMLNNKGGRPCANFLSLMKIVK